MALALFEKAVYVSSWDASEWLVYRALVVTEDGTKYLGNPCALASVYWDEEEKRMSSDWPRLPLSTAPSNAAPLGQTHLDEVK